MCRSIIVSLLLFSTAAQAQTTSGWVNVAMQAGQTRLYTNATEIQEFGASNLTVNGTLTVSKAELSLVTTAQGFTAAAGYEVVTNFTQYSRGSAFTTSATSIVNNAAQDVVLVLTSSLESSAVNNDVECHVFTNGVDTSRIAWHRTIAVADDQGSAAGSGVLLSLPSGVIITVRVDVDKDSTITFDHFSLIAIQQ